MRTVPHYSNAERVGRYFGRSWRALVRYEARATRWMTEHGVPRSAASAVLWIIKLGILATLLYIAFWLALVIILAVVAAAIGLRTSQHPQQHEWLAKPTDHRDDLFYHPLAYNDDPDPRFEDD